MYLLVFVDDILICCQDKIEIDEVKIEMKRIDMKILGKIKSYISIEIDYSLLQIFELIWNYYDETHFKYKMRILKYWLKMKDLKADLY